MLNLRRLIFAGLALLTLILTGCINTNHSIGSLQFNPDIEALPENYAEIAAQYMSAKSAISPLLISTPQTMQGDTPFSAHRWYVCIRGMKPRGKPLTVPPLQRLIEDWVAPPIATDEFDVVLVYRENAPSAIAETYNSRLCRHAEFRPLQA